MKRLWLNVFFAITVLTLSAQSQFDNLIYQTSKTGLQYKITTPGEGELPQTGDLLWVHYMGFLASDTMFSSSLESGPLDFYLGMGQVIKGWDEGLRLLKPGGSMVLKVPPTLGYGQVDYPGIPKGSTLYFEIALLQINKGQRILPFETKGKPLLKDAKGLEYIVVEEGHGAFAKLGDNAYVHYSAFLNDTSLFDSSVKKEDPVRITLGNNEITEGWDAALYHMQEGTKLRVYIPSELAYGEKGYANIVPPNAKVTMDLEMVRLSPEIHVQQWRVTEIIPQTLTNGVQCYVVKEGEGDLIKNENIVTMHYSGFLSDGSVFDSSVKREEEFIVPVGIGAIIEGWDSALLQMKKGGRYQIHIPANMAFGEEGYLPSIPINADLIYDVEIIDVF